MERVFTPNLRVKVFTGIYHYVKKPYTYRPLNNLKRSLLHRK